MSSPGSRLESETGERLTRVAGYSVTQPGTSVKRVIPAPWIDCQHCSWRHYPSISGGRWHIATRCVSCGKMIGAGAAGR
jgi:hypothetical protein